MSLQLSRKHFIGIAKESTPGAPISPTDYIPWVEQSLNARHEPIGDMAAKGTREGQRGSVEGKKWGEGSVKVNLDERLIGHLLLGVFGTVNSSTVSGSIKDHTFSRNNSNTPQTYSLILDRGTDQKLFPYSVINALELTFQDGEVQVSADILSRHPVTSVSGSLTVTSGHLFTWKDASLQFGANLTAAASATPTKVNELTLRIENNATPTWRSGSQEPASIDVGNFRVSGNFRMFFEDTTQLENYRTLTKQALILSFNGRGLAGGLRESLKINLPLLRFDDGSIDTPIDDFATFVGAFEAEYDGTTSKIADAVLRNVTASY